MIVWAIADRFLDIVGMGTILYGCYRLTRWVYRPRTAGKPPKPRAYRID